MSRTAVFFFCFRLRRRELGVIGAARQALREAFATLPF